MVRKVYLVGVGMGNPGTLTGAARDAIRESDLLIGAARLIAPFEGAGKVTRRLARTDDILAELERWDGSVASVLFSGDVGFYSGAVGLAGRLAARGGVQVESVPGISSVAYFCARLQTPWHDAHLVSAHGRRCDPAHQVRAHRKVFFLSGGSLKAQDICAELDRSGLGGVRVCVGERLASADEAIVWGTAAGLSREAFGDLAVLLVENDDAPGEAVSPVAPSSPRETGGDVHGGAPVGGIPVGGAPARAASSGGAVPPAPVASQGAAGAPAVVAAPRLMVCAPASGSGKTLFACALMQALVDGGMRVQACKCGPDYLDPQFHRAVVGTPSRNLDLFFMDGAQTRQLLVQGARQADVTIIESAMGYYDGIAMGDEASAWRLARATATPALLVVDARGRACSLAAEVSGFLCYRRESNIAGVVLNHVSGALHGRLKELVEAECGIPVVGYLPELPDCSLQSRHLGLVAASEVADLQQKLARLSRTLRETVDLEAVVALARAAEPLPDAQEPVPEPVPGRPVIAIARDAAFSFYYEDTLRLLERLGARLAPFSPLADARLPEGACGLYLGGGYPELHARALSENAPMRQAVRAALASGMPAIAECGGFIYLHEYLEDEAGASWPMAAALPGKAFRTAGLRRFGYVELTARRDSLLARAGESLPAHEFHYWDSEDPGDAFHAEKPRSSQSWDCVHANAALYAGFPHLCLHARPQAARRFVEACASYGRDSGACFREVD